MGKKRYVKTCIATGVFAIVVYIVSISWSLFLTVPAQKILHIELLEVAFPGFVWISFGAFLWGAFLSFMYGFLGYKIFRMIYRFFHRMDYEEQPIEY